MNDIALQIVWVAAYHYMRSTQSPRISTIREDLWGQIYDITRELGYPPAPGPHTAVSVVL